MKTTHLSHAAEAELRYLALLLEEMAELDCNNSLNEPLLLEVGDRFCIAKEDEDEERAHLLFTRYVQILAARNHVEFGDDDKLVDAGSDYYTHQCQMKTDAVSVARAETRDALQKAKAAKKPHRCHACGMSLSGDSWKHDGEVYCVGCWLEIRGVLSRRAA